MIVESIKLKENIQQKLTGRRTYLLQETAALLRILYKNKYLIDDIPMKNIALCQAEDETNFESNT